MLDFRRPELKDREKIIKCVQSSGKYGDECAFANVFLFRERYDIEICFYEGFFIQTYWSGSENCGYNYPIGTGDVSKCIDAMISDAKERKRTPRIWLMTKEESETLQELHPGEFEVEAMRNDFDYIYLRTDLASLAGKKYHGKRNHVSRFYKDYPDWHYEDINEDNFHDAVAVASQWHVESGKSAADLDIEIAALGEAYRVHNELCLFGGILYAGQTPCAMTIASMIIDNVCDVHYEKALSEFEGAYAVINQEFAKHVSAEYLNREEDVGDEGLRFAKTSYHPAILLEKFNAEPPAEHIFRKAADCDTAELKELWTFCFRETPEQTELFFSEGIRLCQTYVAVTGATVTSMLCLFPCTVGGVQSHYLYGACTHPEHRRKGLMSELVKYALSDAKKHGDVLSLLLPADKGLYEFYSHIGYLPLHGTQQLIVSRGELINALNGTATAKEPLDISWNESQILYAIKLSQLDSDIFMSGDSVIEVYMQDEKTARISFIRFRKEDEKDLCNLLLENNKSESFVIRMPANGTVGQSGEDSSFGMYLSLSEGDTPVLENGIFLAPTLD